MEKCEIIHHEIQMNFFGNYGCFGVQDERGEELQ